MNSKLPNTDKNQQDSSQHIALKRITILFSALTILSAALSFILHISVPGITPLLFGITIFLFGFREFDLYFKYGREKDHLYMAIIYSIIFLFDLIAAASQLQASLL